MVKPIVELKRFSRGNYQNNTEIQLQTPIQNQNIRLEIENDFVTDTESVNEIQEESNFLQDLTVNNYKPIPTKEEIKQQKQREKEMKQIEKEAEKERKAYEKELLKKQKEKEKEKKTADKEKYKEYAENIANIALKPKQPKKYDPFLEDVSDISNIDTDMNMDTNMDMESVFSNKPTEIVGLKKRELLIKVREYKNLFPTELKRFKVKKNPTEGDLVVALEEMDSIISTSNIQGFLDDSIFNSIKIIEGVSAYTKNYNLSGLSIMLRMNKQFNTLLRQLYLKYGVFSAVPPETQMLFILVTTSWVCIQKNKQKEKINEMLNTPIQENI
jgi:hypothetical protein